MSQGQHIGGVLRVGFVLTNRDPLIDDQAHWIAFCRKAQEAAELSLPKPVAQGLVWKLESLARWRRN